MYKNEKSVYKNPLNYGFWRCAAMDFCDIRKICFAGIMIALSVALQSFSIKLAPALSLQFTFVVSALSGAVCGQYLSFIRGCASDIIGFFVFPTGYPFFLGYTLSAGLGALVYSLLFYRQKITFSRILFAKIAVNVFVNAMLGSLWNVIVLGTKAYSAYFALSISKNLVMLTLEVCVIVFVFSSLIPVLYRMDVVYADSPITYNKNQLIICGVFSLFIFAFFIAFIINASAVTEFLSGIYSKIKEFMLTFLND